MHAPFVHLGEWENWALEAEMLWAAVSERKPRLIEGIGAELGVNRVGVTGNSTLNTTHDWPITQLFPSSIPKGTPTVLNAVSVTRKWEPFGTPIPRSESRDATPTRTSQAQQPPPSPWSVPEWRSTFITEKTKEMKSKRENTNNAIKQRAWQQLEREYLNEVNKGPLAQTPLALRRADAEVLRMTENAATRDLDIRSEFSFSLNAHTTKGETAELLKSNSPFLCFPLPQALVVSVFGKWRSLSIASKKFQTKTRHYLQNLKSNTFIEWRDDVFTLKTHRTVRQAIAFEIWRGKAELRKVVNAVTSRVKSRSVRKNTLGAFTVWKVLAEEWAERVFAADAISYKRRTKTSFSTWKTKTQIACREAAWDAFAKTWRDRRVSVKAFTKWAVRTEVLAEARTAAEKIANEKRFTHFVSVFFTWRRRARMLAAGRELVRLACIKWRTDLLQHTFDRFYEGAKVKRDARETSNAFLKVKLATRTLRNWFSIVRNVELYLYGEGIVAVKKAFGRIYLKHSIDQWRLTMFHSRERDWTATSEYHKQLLQKTFSNWVNVAEVDVALFEQLVQETDRLGWPERVRKRGTFVVWSRHAVGRRKHREDIESEVVIVAKDNRTRRALHRWHLTVSEIVLDRLQLNAAIHHKHLFFFRTFKSEINRRQVARLATQQRLGVSAMRRLATCHAGWRAFVDEMRPIRRRVKRYRDTTRAGHTVSNRDRMVSRSTITVKSKILKAESKGFMNHLLRDAQDAACVGPIVVVATRAKARRILQNCALPENVERTDAAKKRCGLVWGKMVAEDTIFAISTGSLLGAGGNVDGEDDFPYPGMSKQSESDFGTPSVFAQRPPVTPSARTSVSNLVSPFSSAQSSPQGSPSRRRKVEARRPGPGAGGGALVASRSRSASPSNSPLRASTPGFQSASSSFPSSVAGSMAGSRVVSGGTSNNTYANPSPAKPTNSAYVPPRGSDGEQASTEFALQLLRGRVAQRLGVARPARDDGSPSAVSWSPSRGAQVLEQDSPVTRQDSGEVEACGNSSVEGSLLPDSPRRQTSQKILAMQARFGK